MSLLGVPGWLAGAVCAALALFGLVRLALVGAAGRDVEVTRVLMAAVMAGMVLALPVPWWLPPTLLTGGAVLSAYRLLRSPGGDPHGPHRLHHVAGGLAMAYLVVAPRLATGPPTTAGMTGGAMDMPAATVSATSMAAATTPLSMLLLAADLAVLGYFAGAAVLAALSLTRLRPAPVLPAAPAPRTTALCQLVMSVLMLAMAAAML